MSCILSFNFTASASNCCQTGRLDEISEVPENLLTILGASGCYVELGSPWRKLSLEACCEINPRIPSCEEYYSI